MHTIEPVDTFIQKQGESTFYVFDDIFEPLEPLEDELALVDYSEESEGRGIEEV